jgi:hypothetical protein
LIFKTFIYRGDGQHGNNSVKFNENIHLLYSKIFWYLVHVLRISLPRLKSLGKEKDISIDPYKMTNQKLNPI